MTKVIVDHTGICDGHHFKAGEPVELPDDVIAALGDHAVPVDEAKEKAVDETPEDKMVDGKKKKLNTK